MNRVPLTKTVRHQDFYRLPDEVSAVVTKERLHLRVDEHYFAVVIDYHGCVGRRLEQVAKLALRAQSLGYIFDHCDGVQCTPRAIANCGCFYLDPDRASIFSDVALLEIQLVEFATNQLFKLRIVVFPIFRVSDVAKTPSYQLLTFIPDYSTEGVIYSQDPAVVRVRLCYTENRKLEDCAISCFAFTQSVFAT